MSNRKRLFLASFLMLFLELSLIRWTGANVLYLSYFSNFLLLASFLGIGLGFLAVGRKWDLLPWAPLCLGVLAVAILILPITSIGISPPTTGSLIYFQGETITGPPAWIMLPLLFTIVAAIMTMVGQAVGRIFGTLKALDAYRIDILGSLCGIITFTGLAFLDLPSIVWGLIVSALFVVLLWPKLPRTLPIGQAALIVALAYESLLPMTTWSPYYKIQWVAQPTPYGTEYHFTANGVPHQGIRPIKFVENQLSFYLTPYQKLNRTPGSVLIIGAGTGTDVAIALHEGASHVDAVEIDPVLYQLGLKLNGDAPYKDPKVSVYINDGRAFLEQTNTHYDMILLALPDSLTLVSGQSSLRLESYLFTSEAADSFRNHLNTDGIFAEYNYYRQTWLADRLANTLQASYNQPPCLDSVAGDLGAGIVFLTESKIPTALTCTRWVATANAPAPVHDDRPFLYVEYPGIPDFYLWAIAGILLLTLLSTLLIGRGLAGWKSYLDLGFLGAAFMLLETKNIVQFALWFGTTWVVNSLVFTGILLAVLLAIEIARKFPKLPPWFLYPLLAVSLLVSFAVPPDSLLALALPIRLVAAITLAFFPVLIANLIFAERLAGAATSTTAFGINLVGALFGGVLEYSSLVLGYRNLTLVVLLLYACAFLLLVAPQIRYRLHTG